MATRSVTARSDRPMSRWISWVRPDCLPLAASRPTRSAEDPGSSEYSAVTQPLPPPRNHGGTRSSTDAVHSTLVLPIDTRTEPLANSVKSRTNDTGRRSATSRPSAAPGRRAVGSQRVPPAHGGLVHAAPEGLGGLGQDRRAARTVGQRWVTTRRRAPARRAFAPACRSAHVHGRAFVLGGVGGLAQGEVEAGAERRERPLRPGVGRVPQRARRPLEPRGQGDGRMVGAAESQPQITDVSPITVAHLVPIEDPLDVLGQTAPARPGAAYTGTGSR